jgi:hypothetical protein
VVSTRVPDVVADYSSVVHLVGGAEEFAEGCRQVVLHSATERARRIRHITARQEWDAIAAAMLELMAAPESAGSSASTGASA